MFFVHSLEHRINLHPSFFAGGTRDIIEAKLHADVEGTNTGTMMIVAVIDIKDISEPKIVAGTGFAQFDVSYQAVVWRPYRGEVVDGLVTSVVGHGFFVDVAGLTMFVSEAMIPSTFKHTVAGSTPTWADKEGQVIEQGAQVRMRIAGVRSELNQIYAIGSIKEDYLGPLMQ